MKTDKTEKQKHEFNKAEVAKISKEKCFVKGMGKAWEINNTYKDDSSGMVFVELKDNRVRRKYSKFSPKESKIIANRLRTAHKQAQNGKWVEKDEIVKPAQKRTMEKNRRQNTERTLVEDYAAMYASLSGVGDELMERSNKISQERTK